jgi:hypothetical protein
MTKYRFKTKEEFEADDLWNEDYDCPHFWNEEGEMNHFLGQDIPDQFIKQIEAGHDLNHDDWTFRANQCIINSIELSEEETTEILKQVKSLITKKKMETKAVKRTKRVTSPVAEKFVFMDKTVNILNVGYSTCKNVILYGPGE